MNNNDTAKILTDNFEFGLETTIDKLFTDKLESDIIKSWVNTAEKKIDIKKDEQIIRKLFLKILNLNATNDESVLYQFYKMQLVHAINIIIQKRLLSFNSRAYYNCYIIN